jgi:hypothetical protein
MGIPPGDPEMDQAMELYRRQQLGQADPYEINRFEGEHPGLQEFPRNMELGGAMRGQDRSLESPWGRGATTTPRFTRLSQQMIEEERTENPVPHTTQCAWCNAILDRETGEWIPHDEKLPQGGVSHSVCPECKPRLQKEWGITASTRLAGHPSNRGPSQMDEFISSIPTPQLRATLDQITQAMNRRPDDASLKIARQKVSDVLRDRSPMTSSASQVDAGTTNGIIRKIIQEI